VSKGGESCFGDFFLFRKIEAFENKMKSENFEKEKEPFSKTLCRFLLVYKQKD
jgi:hypothetical protein